MRVKKISEEKNILVRAGQLSSELAEAPLIGRGMMEKNTLRIKLRLQMLDSSFSRKIHALVNMQIGELV